MTEHFETWDDRGRPLGLVARDVVHRTGLWHKSAHVFLFNHRNELLIQRRSADKDLYPSLWDFSVGEHLKPGESHLDGAMRGLREELGVTGVALEPLSGVRRASYHIMELGVCDRELQQTFRGRFDGCVTPDPAEVAAVEHVSLRDLARWIRRNPEVFTPWLLEELNELQLLPTS